MTGGDHGPAIRHARGDMEIEWRADPARPGRQVQGARLRDSLREMHRRGRIGDAHWWAVERFRDDLAMMQGQGLGTVRLLPKSGSGRSDWLPGDALLAAQGRVRRLYGRLGPDRTGAVDLVVVGGATLAQLGRHLRCAKSKAGAILHDALDTMADCYNGC